MLRLQPLQNLEFLLAVPPVRRIQTVSFKSEPSKKVDVEWAIAIPKVSFFYREKKKENVIFNGQLDYICLLEKFELKKDENDITNVNTLINTLSKYFDDNKVTIESWQRKYYALEFKGENDRTLFKVYLQN